MSQATNIDRVSATEYIDIKNISVAPDAPTSGTRLYARSGVMYQKTSASGAESEVGAGATYGSDNLLIRSDGTDATQDSGITIDDSDNVTGVTSLSATTLTGTLATAAQANITSVGTLTSLTSNDLTLASGATVTAVLDEDAMGSDSATALATQQSIKAYVAANSGIGASVNGDTYDTAIKVIASDGTFTDYFGSGVACSSDGSVLVVGAPGDDGAQLNSGTAYIYSGADYGTETKLTASDGQTLDDFGEVVCCSGNGAVVIIGATQSDDVGSSSGSAYIYSGASWGTQTKLTASDAATSDNFGRGIACNTDGSIVIVSAYNNGAGIVYVYSGVSWGTEVKIEPSDGSSSDFFGFSIACSSDASIIVVGAYQHGTGGALYIYSGANYATETKIIASDNANNDNFGWSVDCSDDGSVVVAGATGEGSTGGSAYVFTGSSWATETKLEGSDTVSGDRFGYRAACSGDGSTIIIGDWSNSVNNTTGAVYVYSGANYVNEAKIIPGDGANSDRHGLAIATTTDGTTMMVSSPFDDDNGSVYVYSVGTPILTYVSDTAYNRTQVSVNSSGELQLGPGAPKILYGSGAPSATAPLGTLYTRTDGSSTSTRLYVNTDGSTTWTNVTTAA
jgi:hypothetical protein